MPIHPTAVIDPEAELDATVEVGPHAVIEGPVRIGAGTRIRAHAHVSGWTQIGEACDIYPYAVVGGEPQDFHWQGQRSYCKIGNGVILREGASVHRGTDPESSTVVGDECVLLTHAHVGHNCQLGRGVQVQHGALLAGHVTVHDQAILAAGAMVHQFCRIGTLAFLAGQARITMDVPPFLMAYGNSTVIQHNVVGMRRAGYGREALFEIRQAYRTLYRSGLLFSAAVEKLAATVRTDAGRMLVAFLQAPSQRGICAGARHGFRESGGSDIQPTENE